MLFISRFNISGHSMEPTIQSGETVLASGLPYFFSRPKAGDIVVFKENASGKYFVKRITKIENNMYFVEGDNKNHSTDSRKFGMLEKKDIVGKVIFIDIF